MARNSLIQPTFLCKSCLRKFFKPRWEHRQPFSSSPLLSQYNIPPLKPTKSPELDALLLTFRNEFVLPWALTDAHRKLLFNRKGGHATLTNDPGVTVTARSGEEIKLQPLPKAPRLQKRKLVIDLAEHMFKAKDFSNLPAVLEGFEIARTPINMDSLEKVIRKASEADQTFMAVQSFEMVKKTGLVMNQKRGSTRELLLGIHLGAERSGWRGDGLALALKQAEHVAKMMEWDEHKLPPTAPTSQEADDAEDDFLSKRKQPLQEMPEVAGLLLELTALRAVNDLAGKDEDGKVKMYAERTLALWKNGLWEVSAKASQRAKLNALLWWLPLYNGMRAVEGVQLDKSIRESLQEKRKLLGEVVSPVLDSERKSQRRQPPWARLMARYERLSDS